MSEKSGPSADALQVVPATTVDHGESLVATICAMPAYANCNGQAGDVRRLISLGATEVHWAKRPQTRA